MSGICGRSVSHDGVALDFSVIMQGWLREAAKGWARGRASTSNNMAGSQSMLLAVALLSESLALREDSGRDRSALARVDVRAFVERVGRLHRAGRLSKTRYYQRPTKVRQCLRECKDFGLYEPRAPLHRLSGDFAVWPQDVRRPPKDEDDGGEGRALPQVVIDQLLSDTYLDLLRVRHGEDVCMMLRILADTGCRPGELAALMATCLELERTEFIDQETGELAIAWVLVHDTPKVAVKHYRLFVAQSTALLIIEQRERVVARYRGTPLSALRLFPRDMRNPHGTLPASWGRLSDAVRGWRDGLPKLVGTSGEDYPRERVIPYAFRHSFAQRHADNGTPLDVLAAMTGHRTIDTTRATTRWTSRGCAKPSRACRRCSSTTPATASAQASPGSSTRSMTATGSGRSRSRSAPATSPATLSPQASLALTGIAASVAPISAPTRPTCPSCAGTCRSCWPITSA